MLLIDWSNKCHWSLWKWFWIVQRRHLTCTKTTIDFLYKDDIYLVQRLHLTFTKMTFDLYKDGILSEALPCDWLSKPLKCLGIEILCTLK